MLTVALAGCADRLGLASRDDSRRGVVEEDLVRLDDAGQPILARPERLSVQRNGRLIISDISDKDVKVYGTDGRRVATYGRPGRGPGEFAAMLTAQAYGDSVVAYDFESSRLTVFSPDGHYARAVSLGHLHFFPGRCESWTIHFSSRRPRPQEASGGHCWRSCGQTVHGSAPSSIRES